MASMVLQVPTAELYCISSPIFCQWRFEYDIWRFEYDIWRFEYDIWRFEYDIWNTWDRIQQWHHYTSTQYTHQIPLQLPCHAAPLTAISAHLNINKLSTHTHTHTHTLTQNTELNTSAHSHTRIISYLWGKSWLLEGAPCCNRRTCCQPRVDLWLGLTFFSGQAL
jgi:hypothetical protein